MPGIVIIGAGFGGIGMAIALKRAGFGDFVILEQSEDLGGTWYDNQYPGCACDVPSPLYSYSFELNPSWSRLFAPQEEIWDYLRACARKYGVDEHIRYGHAVEHLDWDEGARRWTIATSGDAGDGHRAQVFQRTPPWVLPRPNRAIPDPVRQTLEAIPLTARASREAIYWMLEARAFGFAVHPKLMAPLEQMASRHIRKQIADPGQHLESQIQHVMSCLRRLAVDQANTIEVSEPALRHYNDALQRRLRRAVWSEGGCHSWYLDAGGINRTLWPGFSFEHWARTRRARRSAYAVTPGAR